MHAVTAAFGARIDLNTEKGRALLAERGRNAAAADEEDAARLDARLDLCRFAI